MNQRSLDAKRIKETDVLRSDHTAADYHHRNGKPLHLQNRGGIENIVFVEQNIFRSCWSRAGCHENNFATDRLHRAIGTGDLDRVGIDDAGSPGHPGDVVPRGGEVPGSALLLASLDKILAVHETVQCDVGFELYVQTLAKPAGAEAGEE